MEQRLKSVHIMKTLRNGSHGLISGIGRFSERPLRSEINDEPHLPSQPGCSQCCQQLGISVTTALQSV